MNIDITRLVPRFILNDRNGYALAKALEVGLKTVAGIVESGVKCVTDVSEMPEWRLDEMAWEFDCLYDTKADVEVKRHFIQNVRPMHSIDGTKAGVVQYLRAMFEDADIDETLFSSEFAFDVTLYGDITPESYAWAEKAVETAKNVRSVMNGEMSVGGAGAMTLEGNAEWFAIEHRRCGALICGESEV